MIFMITEYAGRHPFACYDQFPGRISCNVGPASPRNHSDMGDVRIYCFCYICKMSLAIINEKKTRRRLSIFSWHASSTNEQIQEAIVIKIVRYGNSCADSVQVISKGRRLDRKIPMTVILK